MHLLTIITKLWAKLGTILQHPGSWVAGFLLFIADAATRGKLIIYLVVIACVVDMFCGIAVSIKRKAFTRSELMRLTVEKLFVYGSVMLVFLCIDEVVAARTDFQMNISSSLVGIIITLTEGVSFTASLLILFPKNPFLRFMQKALRAELASKLNVSEEEVDGILDEYRTKKKK